MGSLPVVDTYRQARLDVEHTFNLNIIFILGIIIMSCLLISRTS